MNHRMKNRVSLFLLPLVAVGALAQEVDPNVEQPEIRRYTVEMIVFSYAQNVSAGSEVFLADEPPPVELILEDELLSEIGVEEIPEVPTDEMLEEGLDGEGLDEEFDPYKLVMLAEEEFILLDVAERLDRLDAYTLLMHFGWTQPTVPEEETESLPLDSFVQPPEGLEGNISLYLSRYLHLAVNLQLQAPIAIENDDSLQQDEPNDYYGDYDDYEENRPLVYPVQYRIEEDRIFRNGELRYFDHPKFGVLAKITRAEEVDMGAEELLGETDLLGFGSE
jgi:hypothetical protein